MTTRLLLIRHGQHDPRGRFLQHACTGLTTTGIGQAQALAARLVDDLRLDGPMALSSKSKRAIETAEIVAATLGISVAERTCDLCEMHPGAAEGLTPAEMELRWGPSYASVPNAEHFPVWLPGACRALRRLGDAYRGRTVLAITHSAVITASYSAFGQPRSIDAAQAAWTNTGITEWICPDAGGGRERWQLARENDAAHLDSALTDSPRLGLD